MPQRWLPKGLSLSGSGAYAVVPRNADLDVGTGNGMTVEGWVNPQDGSARPIFEWADTSVGSGVHMWANYAYYEVAGYLYVNLWDINGSNHSTYAYGLSTNALNHVAVTYDKAAGAMKLYINGVTVQSLTPGAFTPQTTFDFYLGYRPCCGGTPFKGLLDEFAVYNRALSSTEIAGIYTAGCGGKCKADTNANGVPDLWETQWFGGTMDPNDDPDGDGLTNLQEFLLGSRPLDTMVVAWGDNSKGQCDVPSALRDVVAVAGGRDFSLALKRNGTVVGWGSNTNGQTSITAGLSNAVSISANWYDGVALRKDGTVAHWGASTNANNIPGSATGLSAVSMGYDSVLALKSNGNVLAWGQGTWRTNVPGSLSGVAGIAAGINHSVAVLTNGNVTAWGIGGSSLGWGLTNVPVSATNAATVAAGALHTLVLRKDGTVVAWGNNADGQTNVPTGLSNVTAVAAGWSSGLALRTNGSLVTWGGLAAGAPTPMPQGLSNALAIGSGAEHHVALRGGRLIPLILSDPKSQIVPPNSNATFSVRVASLGTPAYQWKFYGTNLAGKTNATLTLSSVQSANAGPYHVAVTNGAGGALSATGMLQLVGAPIILFPTNTVYQWFGPGATLSLNVVGGTNNFGVHYYWKRYGTNIPGAPDLPVYMPVPLVEGDYSVTLSNVVGSATSSNWVVRFISSGAIGAWGRNDNGQLNRPVNETNTIGIAAGLAHSLAVRESGTVFAWGANDYGQTNAPLSATNGISVAAGSSHSLVLRADGTVVGWGRSDLGQTNAPPGLNNAVAISAGGQQSLALKSDGTVVQWGQTNANVPAGLAGVSAIASGTNFQLALKTNATVVAWGVGQGTNVPAGLTNVVAIAAGGEHALALKKDGMLAAWGSSGSGETNVTGISNVMAIAAGRAHNLALKNDGTVIAWGDNTYGQTNVQLGLPAIKLIAAGGDFNLESAFSPLIQYPIDVSKDLLLVYNTNSLDSSNVCSYYLSHRPMVSNANVLGIGFTGIFVTNMTVYETVTPIDFTNKILNAFSNWLTLNPTKRPEYVVLFPDIPSRVNSSASASTNYPFYAGGTNVNPSVSCQLATSIYGWSPLITYINMSGTNDCRAYIDKLAINGGTGKVLLSASAGGYGNTNFVFDNVRHGPGWPFPEGDYTGQGFRISNAIPAVTNSGTPGLLVIYLDGIETNGVPPLPHITNALNVAGYACWGFHSSLGSFYPTNQSIIWTGKSGWYAIETFESQDGRRFWVSGESSTFVWWFQSNGFGGTSYANTPVGAVTYVDEPGLPNVNDTSAYFGSWARGKNFAISAWSSRRTIYFQAVGDPLVSR